MRFLLHITHLIFPLFHFFPFEFSAIVFGAHGGGDGAGEGLDLMTIRLFKTEVVASLKVFLPLQESLPFLIGILHIVLDDLVVRWDPSCIKNNEFERYMFPFTSQTTKKTTRCHPDCWRLTVPCRHPLGSPCLGRSPSGNTPCHPTQGHSSSRAGISIPTYTRSLLRHG